MSASTSQLEHEVEASRDRVERTVDALKEKMTIGQIVDEVASYVGGSGGGQTFANLGAQVRDNPLPVALVGIGVAWLMMGHGPAAATRDEKLPADRPGRDLAGVGSRLSLAADAAGHATDAVRDGLRDASGQLRVAARQLGGAGDNARRAIADLVHDEPLIVGAIGLAVGTAIGAMLPSTEAEDRLFGDQRDALVDEAAKAASEQLDHAKDVASDALDTMKGAAGEAYAEVKTAVGDSLAGLHDKAAGGTDSGGSDSLATKPASGVRA